MQQPTSASFRSRATPYLLALLVFASSAVIVFLLWRDIAKRTQAAELVDVRAEAASVESLLRQRIDSYELIMRGGASVVQARNGAISRDEWHSYVGGLHIDDRFPAVMGLGYAAYVDAAGLQRLQLQMREQSGRYFVINPQGQRPEYGPILYLYPETTYNLSAVGFDMYSEQVRHQAMQQAMESGVSALSGPVTLVQDRDRPEAVGMLIYMPVYRPRMPVDSADARRAAMVGWTYIPFRVQDFVDASVKPIKRMLDLRVRDVTQAPARVIYSDPGMKKASAQALVTHRMAVYGRELELEFHAAPQATNRSLWVLFYGLPLAAMLAAIVFLLARTQSRAQALATQMTHAYARSEAVLRTAMVHSGIGKALLDADGIIVDVNPAMSRLFERTADSLRGQRFQDLLDSGSIGVVDDKREDGVRREIRRFVRRDGEFRHLSLVYGSVPPAEGVDIALLVQAEDISERIRSEARIRALNRTLESRVEARTRELSEANRELESFAYSVSHDLRAPLRAIEGFSQILGQRHSDQLDDTGQQYLGKVRTAARRMGELIESILTVSRIGRAELQRQPLDMSALAQEVVDDLQAGEPERKVLVQIAPGMEAVGDPRLVRNLLQNLIGNAWKFTQNEPSAHIEIYRNGEGAFVVQDNGAGFDPAYSDKLFRPFQRLHSESEFAGHGIGLASVKRILERHGGQIRAEAEAGKGARFLFVLPSRSEVSPDRDGMAEEEEE